MTINPQTRTIAKKITRTLFCHPWTPPRVRVKLLHHLQPDSKQVTKAGTQIRRWQSGWGITWVVMANCAFSHCKVDAEPEGIGAPLGRARAEWSLWFPASQLQRETCQGQGGDSTGGGMKIRCFFLEPINTRTVSRSSAGWGVEPSEVYHSTGGKGLQICHVSFRDR